MTGTHWRQTRRALAPLLLVLLAAFLVLFEREWRHGEVFSPADLVLEAYPWAHDRPRTRGANPTRSDEAFYHQPLMTTHFERLREGHLPDYDDTRLAGVPSFFQGLDVGRAFSPMSLPFYLLPAEDAVSWYGPLRLLVAALCMWLFLRDLGAGPVAAAGGGVAFALNGHFLTWLSAPMPTVAAWLPLVLRQVRRCVHHTRWLDVAGLSLALGAMFTGAYLATTLVCLAGIGVYAACEIVATRRWRAVAPLAGGGVLGLLVGAVALGPMLYALRTSPAAARVVSAEGALWANLATLALPDFWGSPLRGTWWHPDPTASYPEHVAYLGVTVIMLAALGLMTRLPASLRVVRWCFAALTVLALTRAYGIAPGRWLVFLPGQAQSNPFRWYALAACGLSVLAGLGLHGWLAEEDRRRRVWQIAAPAAAGAALALACAAALLVWLPDIRARDLQSLQRMQVLRFAAIAGATGLVMAGTACLRGMQARTAGGLLLVLLAAGDLVQAHRSFNPTVPREDYYPITAGLDWLREQAADARIAPVDTAADLVEGHVWSMYGLSTVTGFDFHGDRDYQNFLRLAQQPPGASGHPSPAVWGYVGLRRDTLDLRMLGVLGARFVAAAPLDSTPRSGGYTALGPITDGRTVTFTVPVRYDGVRRIDLLAATYARANRGRWLWTVTGEAGSTMATGSVQQSALRDNDWWRLEWPPAARSAGRTLTVTVRGEGSGTADSATLLATATPATPGATLVIDGAKDPRSLWFRTFSTAPGRFDGAPLVHAGDLNVYRNPHARPRAWFVERVSVTSTAAHALAMHTTAFDPVREAYLSQHASIPAVAGARVTSIALEDDRRVVGLEAPDGGILILAERAHQGWKATIDGRDVPWQVANAVLIGVEVPPGSRTLTLTFFQPALRPSLVLSLLAVAGITFASVLIVRRRRTAFLTSRVGRLQK